MRYFEIVKPSVRLNLKDTQPKKAAVGEPRGGCTGTVGSRQTGTAIFSETARTN